MSYTYDEFSRHIADPTLRPTWVHFSEHFDISHKQGVITFVHKERGTATYDINSNTFNWLGKNTKYSIKTYFQGYMFEGCGWYARHPYNEYRKSLNYDFARMEDKIFARFMIDTVIRQINTFEQSGAQSIPFMLPFIKKFENNFHWTQIGIQARYLMSFSPADVSKDVVKILIKENFVFSTEKVSSDDNTIPLFEELIRCLDNEKIHNTAYTERGHTAYIELVEQLEKIRRLQQNKYEVKDIVKYLFNYLLIYEGFTIGEALRNLDDYANMQVLMNVPDFKKYPKFLRSNHDIIAVEFNKHKREIDEVKFQQRVNLLLEYFNEKENFCVIVPKSSRDVVDEGKQMSHCVGGYIDRIISGDTKIMFMRKFDEKHRSWITLECRDGVLIQAKGHANRNITSDERKLIEKYCKARELLMRV